MGSTPAAARRRWASRGPDPSTVGGRIRLLREARGWTQAELAAAIGRSKSAVGMMEAGRTMPTVYVLRDLRRIFGVSVDYILFREGRGL